MISPHNILKLIKGNSTMYHSAVLTCYTFDPVFFGAYYLPVLRNVGIVNVVVLMDSRQYDVLMQELPKGIDCSLGYTLIRMKPGSGVGVFHPKISFLVGEKQGLLLIGSGNLTYSGISLNDEVWGEFEISSENNRFSVLFRQVWAYICSFLPHLPRLLSIQLGWMEENSEWLSKLLNTDSPVNETVITEDSIEVSFVCNIESDSIYTQIRNKLINATVTRLIVVSPFYDVNGGSIDKLSREFHIPEIQLIIDPDNGTVPHAFSEQNARISIYKWCDVYKDSRKLHAKIFQFETNLGTYLLIGSANATSNALGLNSKAYNDEVGLFLYDSSGRSFVQEMGITLSEEGMSISDLQDYKPCPIAQKPNDVFHLHILSAQIINDKLEIELDGNAEDCYIDIFDISNECIRIPYRKNIPVQEISLIPHHVVISNIDGPISNRYTILNEDDILKYNPNIKNSKLKHLIAVSNKWDDNLASILQYITLDTDRESSTKVITPKINVHGRNKADEKVSKERFDYLTSNFKAELSTNSNLLIAELFNAIFDRGYEDETTSDLTEKEQENISVANITETEEQKEKRHRRTSKTVNFYLRKLDKHYNAQMPKRKMTMGYDRQKFYATLNDYSALVVASHIILFELTHNDIPKTSMQFMFMSVISKATILYTEGFEYTDFYCRAKMKGMLKRFYTNAMLLFAHFRWGHIQTNDVRIVLLNLFYQLRFLNDDNKVSSNTIKEIETIMSELLQDAERNKLSICDTSLLLVKETFDLFCNFVLCMNNDSKYLLSELSEGDIIKVPIFGFVALESYYVNQSGFYQYKFYHPAFTTDDKPELAAKTLWVLSDQKIDHTVRIES